MNKKVITEPIILLGMHRSGTSLFSSWLNKCGVHMGDNMMGSGIGNVKGHFEDIDFYNFHVDILTKNNVNYLIKNNVKLKYDNADRINANRIYQNHLKMQPWGWKDPITCLTMDLWDSIIPNYKIIFIYRDYNKVVDSLVRRSIKELKNWNKKLFGFYKLKVEFDLMLNKTATNFLKTWIQYNSRVLEHLEKMNSDDFLIINLDSIEKYDSDIYQFLEEKWSFKPLEFTSFNSVFDSNLVGDRNVSFKYCKNTEDSAIKLLLNLEALELNGLANSQY